MKNFILIILLISCFSTQSQPELNEKYNFGRLSNISGAVISTDSCYYSMGTVTNETVTNHLDAVFTKYDFDGNILNQGFVHNDSLDLRFFLDNNFITTYDGDFIALGTAPPYFSLIKFNHYGDTIFSKVLTGCNLNFNSNAIVSAQIIQNNVDSSFSCLGWVQHDFTFKHSIFFFKLDKEGNVISESFHSSTLQSQNFLDIIPGDMIKTQDQGYLIVSSIIKYFVPVENSRYHLNFMKLDSQGVYEWDSTNFENDFIFSPEKIIEISDGYIICGSKGVSVQSVTYWRKNYIAKLNLDFSLDWEIEYGNNYSYQIMGGFTDFKQVSTNEFIACGRYFSDTIVQGCVIKFNDIGEIIWESQLENMSYNGSPDIPENGFYSMDITNDNGLVFVGNANDMEAVFSGNQGQNGWLVKLDSVGCLIGDCQDFLSSGNVSVNHSINTFPNPVKSSLTIHLNNFNQCNENYTVEVYKINGEIVVSLQLIAISNKLILNIKDLSTGFYILKLYNCQNIVGIEKIVKI